MKLQKSETIWCPKGLTEYLLILPKGDRPPKTEAALLALAEFLVDRLVEEAEADGSLADANANLPDLLEQMGLMPENPEWTAPGLVGLMLEQGGSFAINQWRDGIEEALQTPQETDQEELLALVENLNLGAWIQSALM